jgi:hypothetical protein
MGCLINSFHICANTISVGTEVMGYPRLVVTLSTQIQLVGAIHVDKGWCPCGLEGGVHANGMWCLCGW